MEMLALPYRVRARVPRWRRVAARAASESGDSMIEVVMAVLIVVLLAGATFMGFAAASQLSGQQRHEAEADQIAQQDEERLRGLTSTELSATAPGTGTTGSTYGNVTYQVPLGGETYTVTSTTRFVSASGGASSCTTGGTSTADYVETASQVSWLNSNDGRPPVIEHSVIAPPTGGSLIVAAEIANTTTGLAGVTITVTGPGSSTTTQTLTTDSNGCTVFGGLAPGTYSVAESDSGYATPNGVTTQSALVVAGNTQTITFQLGQLGGALATFQTFINGLTPTAINWDSFSISNSNVTPSPQSFGTGGGALTTTVSSSPSTVFPTSYNAYAGTCAADDPEGSTATTGTTGTTGSTPAAYTDPVLTVPAGATGSATVTVPTMLLELSETYGSTNTTVNSTTLPYAVTTYDSCTPPVERDLATAPTLIAANTSYPVPAPYGTSVQVCFTNTVSGVITNTGALPSGATQLSNTNLNGTTLTTLQLPLATSATGASAKFLNSGACAT
jgi:hypothetical protein